MAVDSLRETRHINRIGTRDLGVLWSAQSYRPDITAALRKIRSMSWRPLSDLCVNAIGPGPHPTFVAAGHPCLKTKNVLGIVVDATDVDFVDPNDAKRWPHYLIERENLVLNVTGAGSIGRVGMYFGTDRPLTNQHLAKLSIAPGTDAAFVCAYLASWWGERSLEQGISGSTGQLNLVNDHLRQVPVPVPDSLAQHYIGDKVRQAERLRERARRLRDSVQASFLASGFVAVPEPIQKVGRVRCQNLIDRLDALHYRADLLRNLEKIRQHPTISLGSQQDFGELGDGDHGNPVYGAGPIYVRATELDGGLLDGATDVRLDEAYGARLPSSVWATAEDVMFSIVATLGAVGIVEDGTRAVMSRGVAKVRPLSLPKHYVKAFMRTPTFGLELLRRSVGTIQRGVYLESLQGLEIPLLPSRDIELIASAEADSDSCVAAARRVVAGAKLLVEHLIDGRLTEADLVAAQKALEAGDRSADREILRALRQSDAPDAKPLIADVDALYALLDGSEGQDA